MSEAAQRFEVISIKHLAGLVVLQTIDGGSVQAPLQSGGLVTLAPAEDTRLPPAVPGLDAVFAESIMARNAAADDAMNADLLRQISSNSELLEIGRKAIEDALVEWRDARLSESLRGNGLVVRNADGEASSVIRFGPERALTIALRAIAEHLSRSAGSSHSETPNSSDVRPLGRIDTQWWLEQRPNIIEALAAKGLRIVSNAKSVRLASTGDGDQAGRERCARKLRRDEVIALISPLSNNSADHDIEFAHRVMDALGAQGTVTLTDGTVLREGEDYERNPSAPAAKPRIVGYLTERGQFYGSLRAMPTHEHATARPLTFADGEPS